MLVDSLNRLLISLLALLGRGSADSVKVRRVLQRELSIYEAGLPVLGFDVTTNKQRLAAHVVRELLT